MRTTNQTRGYYNSLPLTPGILAGIGSFITGLLLTRHFVSFGTPPNVGVEVNSMKIVAWYFYNAHYVGLSETASGFGNSMAFGSSVDLIPQSAPEYEFLRLIPPIALVFGGMVLAARNKNRTASFAMTQGVQVTIGYLPLALIGSYLASKTAAGFGVTARLGPSYFDTFLIAGLIYPIVFGAVGGLLIYIAQNN